MRTEKKLANGNVLVMFDTIDKLSVRPAGADNKYKYENWLKIDAIHNRVIIDKEIMEAYGMVLEVRS